MSDLEFLFVLLIAAAILVRVADLIRVPFPIVLVLAGLGIGFVPGLPDVNLDPDVVFLVFLPPLLCRAAFQASPQELRLEAGPLGWLALGVVLATIGSVAVVAHAVVDGLGWAEAFVLGAVVAPTDPVAALAAFSRVRAPERVRLLVEGESMINDASALVAFGVAVGVATGDTFSVGDALLDFVVSVIGGLAIGLAIARVQRLILERLSDRPLSILWTLLTAYAQYIAAEKAGVSGVLAVVVGGIYLGWHSSTVFDADVRLSATAFWETLDFALNALIFILLGLQFPALTADLPVGDVLGPGLAIAGVVIVVRLALQFMPWAGTGESWGERVVVGWSGMRGAISLAAALSIPLDVAGRDQLIVLTFVVILVTLVGQGLTLPPLLKMLALPETRTWSPEEAVARLEAAQAALERLEEIEDEFDGELPEPVKRLQEIYRTRFRVCQAILSGERENRERIADGRLRFGALRRELIGVERESLLELRSAGQLRPETLRAIERDLDLEEARLR
ncbi:MAG: monovalent cation/hydrogen antiporter [Solirubrobacteraceae bacterium]|nr:monovalent cation/hydrogen antiporter [Solirubrobacteraceae bacterium]